MIRSVDLYCETHKLPLKLNNSQENLVCSSGCSFPVIGNIPRFVPVNNYAASFGLQWNTYRTTQLDSYTGIPISENRLKRLLGGSLEILKGKSILEAGCGAGRFTEIILKSGGQVFAADISTAVEANYENCGGNQDYFVCQADILHLPVKEGQFDIVICIGVIQHTPNPEQTMAALCSYVKPGGMLVIDHYSQDYPITLFRRILRSLLIRMPKKVSLKTCQVVTGLLWPFHKLLWKFRENRLVRKIRPVFIRVSPVVDYHDSYPELGPEILRTWAVLDTHDTVTDFYKHLRNAEEIKKHLQNCGMIKIETEYAGNGVEVRASKPSD